MKSVLRPHQKLGLDLLRKSFSSGKRRPMVQAPTGAGKTKMAAAITEGARLKKKRVVFTVPAISLIDQTVSEFAKEGIEDIGVIQADHELTNPEAKVQVASVQTLEKRIYPEADLVLIDEAHRRFKTIEKWMMDPLCEGVPFIGLSATPWTKGLGKFYDDLLIPATTRELIDEGDLSDFQVFAPSVPDLSGVRTVAGDWNEGQLAERMDTPKLVGDIVSTWCSLGQNRPTFVFAVNRAHAKHIADTFEKAGVSTGYIDAFTPIEERNKVRDAFHDGSIKVVCNVGCLTTGVDWDVRCIVLARPTKSEILFVQMIGRGLRNATGKMDCLILDHSDTHQRLGFVTDIHHEKLDDGAPKESSGGTKEAKEKLPKVCPSCSIMKPIGMHECPNCGFTPDRKDDVETAEGELVAIKGKARKFTEADKTRWWSEILGYCHEKSKSRGFGMAVFKEKFDEWPKDKWGVSPVRPTDEIKRYIVSRNIAWAKRRKKERAMA